MNLTDIEARIAADRDNFGGGWTDQSIRDREALLAMVKKQVATLEAVRDLANQSGKRGWHVSPNDIRSTLDAS